MTVQRKEHTIEMTPVKSSNIQSVGYDRKLLVLRVKFWSGPTYEYEPVPVEVYRSLMAAGSPSEILREVIIPYFHAKRL